MPMTIDAERQARDLLPSHFRRDIAVNRLKLGYRKFGRIESSQKYMACRALHCNPGRLSYGP